VLLRGEFLGSDNSATDLEFVIPVRTSSSLQQKWSKFVQPVTKFVSLTNTHPKKVGKVSCVFCHTIVVLPLCDTNIIFHVFHC